jgi:hypothetical protein
MVNKRILKVDGDKVFASTFGPSMEGNFAYSAARYGADEWRKLIDLLLETYPRSVTEKIVRSKYARWGADACDNPDKPTAADAFHAMKADHNFTMFYRARKVN